MPLALTCTCGVRLDIDEKFAGQTIHCPDCHQPLLAPLSDATGRRTSGLALTSIILALVGAFTVVGTIAAVLVGALALVHIRTAAPRLAGRSYAVAGMVIGAIMTAGTIAALSSVELFGLAGYVVGATWAGKLEFPGQLEVVRGREGFAITRPTKKWGVYTPSPAVNDFWNNHVLDDLLLVLPDEDAIVLCYASPSFANDTIEVCREKVDRDFRTLDKDGLFNKIGSHGRRNSSTETRLKRPLPTKDHIETIEMEIDKQQGKEDKRFLVRVLKREGDDQMFVVIGGVRKAQFARLEGQIRDAMDSFRLLPRNANRDW